MKFFNSIIFLGLFSALAVSGISSHLAHSDDDRLTQNHFSVNFQNADVTGLLALVAAQAGLTLKADKEMGVLVTMNQPSITAKEVLDKLNQDQQIEYTITGNQLTVTKKGLGMQGAGSNVYQQLLKYADSKEILAKLLPLVPTTDKLIADEHQNAIILVGSEESWKRIQDVIGYLDNAETQILIEAQILETSSQFLRDIGVSLGNTGGNHSITTTNPIASTPNFNYSGVFNGILGSALEVQVSAAETSGAAKVISKPKVLTLNNQKAKIESGVTINVKTLSTAISNPTAASGSTSTGLAGLAATSGITTINAGLSLEILPSIVGKDMIKLSVNINDSQPDQSEAVDGIPAVTNNSASTSIIVKNGETAIIAGLMKQSRNHSSTGVPFFSAIPIIGILFGSNTRADQNNELVIFITPTIDGNHVKVSTTPVAQAAF